MAKEKMSKKVMALGAAALIAATGAGAIGHALMAEPQVVTINDTVIVDATPEQLAEAFEEGVASVPTPEPVVVVETETKEVLVDNGNLAMVLDELYDMDGDVSYLTEDLDEDEIAEVVDRLVFKMEAESMAEELVKAEIVEYLDDEDEIIGKGDLKGYRDNDVYSVIVDSDDTVFEATDFDDSEATVYVEAKLKLDDGDDKTSVRVIAEVEVEGSDVEIVNVVLKE